MFRALRAGVIALLLIVASVAAWAQAITIQQSSTSRKLLFLMIDSADHITGKTGLTVTATLSKNGAAFGAPAGTVAEVANGWYALTPTSADTGTVGDLVLHATATGADPADRSYNVVAFNPDDSVALGLSSVSTTSARVLLALPAAAPNSSGGLSAPVVFGGTASAGSAGTITLAGASATDTYYVGDVIITTGGTGAGQARTVLTYVGATKIATVDRTWITNPDATTTYAVVGIPGAALSASLTVTSSDTPGTTTLLTRVPSAGVPTLAQIQAGVPTDASVATDVWGAGTRTLTAQSDPSGVTTLLGRITGNLAPTTGDAYARIGAAGAGLTSVALAGSEHTAIAADVLDATASAHNTAGSIGAKINSAGSAGDPWTTLLSTESTNGSFGALLKQMLFDGSGNIHSIVETYAAGQDPATLLQAMVVDGTFTLKQANALQLAIAAEGTRTYNASTHTAVATYYRRLSGGTGPDLTKPIMVKTTTYDSTDTQPQSQSIVFSNLP